MNQVYHMDNLQLLKTLEDNSIDLIYSDILFNTGRKFEDYDDNLGTPQEAILWYKPRLEEMRRVLKDTGNIYLHMDYRLCHYMKVAMDEIFGFDNFVNEIIWHYNSAPRKKKCFGNRHDTILRYSKTQDFYFDDTQVREPYSETAPRGYEKEKYYNPLGKVWGDVWKINMLGQNDKTERVGYSTQKPKELIKPIILSSCPENGIVADFFCGSGTTLVVAKELGRNYIGCDINKKAVDISINRIFSSP
jgi:DNA modification methylase